MFEAIVQEFIQKYKVKPETQVWQLVSWLKFESDISGILLPPPKLIYASTSAAASGWGVWIMMNTS
jgi:hypothetical protein